MIKTLKNDAKRQPPQEASAAAKNGRMALAAQICINFHTRLLQKKAKPETN
jgi:hypothetical protein